MLASIFRESKLNFLRMYNESQSLACSRSFSACTSAGVFYGSVFSIPTVGLFSITDLALSPKLIELSA